MSTWRLSILMPPGFWSFNLVWTKIGWILTYNSFAWLPEISWKIQRSNYQSHLACSNDPTTNSKSLNPEFSQNFNYRGSPTYTKITNMVSTTTVLGLCTCKWGFCPWRGLTTVPLTQISWVPPFRFISTYFIQRGDLMKNRFFREKARLYLLFWGN